MNILFESKYNGLVFSIKCIIHVLIILVGLFLLVVKDGIITMPFCTLYSWHCLLRCFGMFCSMMFHLLLLTQTTSSSILQTSLDHF